MYTIEENLADWPKSVVIYTDGASRGNPGDASIGVYVQSESGDEIFKYGEVLGVFTNNHAEYTAVKKSLELALENKVSSLTIKSDSQLLVRQINGIYKVKSAELRPIFEACRELIKKIPNFEIEHVRREFNKEADRLANLALDNQGF